MFLLVTMLRNPKKVQDRCIESFKEGIALPLPKSNFQVSRLDSSIMLFICDLGLKYPIFLFFFFPVKVISKISSFIFLFDR